MATPTAQQASVAAFYQKTMAAPALPAVQKTLQTGFYVGPGDWLYYVKADPWAFSAGVTSIQIAYSPKARAWVYQTLDAATMAKVKAELSVNSRALGNQAAAAKQAYAKIRPESATAGSAPASSSGSSYSPSAMQPSAAPAPAGGTWSQLQPYAPYAVVGVGVLVAAYILLSKPGAAPAKVAA